MIEERKEVRKKKGEVEIDEREKVKKIKWL